jgi:hypothetical protein
MDLPEVNPQRLWILRTPTLPTQRVGSPGPDLGMHQNRVNDGPVGLFGDPEDTPRVFRTWQRSEQGRVSYRLVMERFQDQQASTALGFPEPPDDSRAAEPGRQLREIIIRQYMADHLLVRDFSGH